MVQVNGSIIEKNAVVYLNSGDEVVFNRSEDHSYVSFCDLSAHFRCEFLSSCNGAWCCVETGFLDYGLDFQPYR